MQKQKFQELVEKFLDESATLEEKRQLATFLEDASYLSLLDSALVDQLSIHAYEFETDQAILRSIEENIDLITLPSKEKSIPAKHRIGVLRKWGWAAAVVIFLGTIAYLWTSSKYTQPMHVKDNTHFQDDILPGGNKAILTLADGTVITLDSAENGLIAQQGDAAITKLDGDRIQYDIKGASQGALLLNTMTTPKGGQYRLTLPDGTRVWLNAASSITYPTVFAEDQRKVRITGEVYFEVRQNKQRPFLVDVIGQSVVEVLGTHFNVHAYGNENNIATTLLEGSVKVHQRAGNVLLQPGEQAKVLIGEQTQPNVSIIKNADIEKVMAWKNGAFNFTDANLEDVMKQLARWYDIEVIYESTIPNIELKGEMSRDVSLNGLLKQFGKMGVHCRLKGRTLVVLP